MNSTIEIPLSETAQFAKLVDNLHNHGITFDAKMECGNWVITIPVCQI